MVNTIGDNFIKKLLTKYSIDDITIVQRTSDDYFLMVEKRFPLYGSKIDWDNVNGAIQKMSNVQSPTIFLNDILNFINEIGAKGNFTDKDRVIVIGDSAIEEAIRMPIKILKEILKELLQLPQHLYIVHENGDWCLTVTMEGNLCFGHAIF